MVWGWLVTLWLCLPASLSQEACRYVWFIPTSGASYYLQTPGYPWRYPPGTHCLWSVFTDPGSYVTIDCSNLDITNDDGSCDQLTLRSTLEDGTICAPFRTQSSTNRFQMELNSSLSSSGGRFSCRLSAKVQPPCDCGWSFRQKIVGGEEAGVNEFPMMVSLVDARLRSHVCGASLISPRHVLTAAHCLDVLNPALTGILVGEHDFTTGRETNATRMYPALRFVYHPRWNRTEVANDIGLVVSRSEIQFNMKVGPACLPFRRPNLPAVKDFITITGWGSPAIGEKMLNRLNKVDIQVVEGSSCKEAFKFYDPDTQLCTFSAGKDSCQFDSGGPLLFAEPQTARYFLAGLVSYGRMCAGPEPAVSTWIYPYLDWVKAETQETFCIK